MRSGIREILVICDPASLHAFQVLLGDGGHLGVDFSYAVQREPRGIADALIIGEDYVGGGPCALILGDNLFSGPGTGRLLRTAAAEPQGCVLFGKRVADPERYGIAEFDESGRVRNIEEKPRHPSTDYAVTGLYFYDGRACEFARQVRPSRRGELEITDVNLRYVADGNARLVALDADCEWLDTGTAESMFEAGRRVRRLHELSGERAACLEEVALDMGFIDAGQCYRLGEKLGDSPYGRYVMEIAQKPNGAYRR